MATQAASEDEIVVTADRRKFTDAQIAQINSRRVAAQIISQNAGSRAIASRSQDVRYTNAPAGVPTQPMSGGRWLDQTAFLKGYGANGTKDLVDNWLGGVKGDDDTIVHVTGAMVEETAGNLDSLERIYSDLNTLRSFDDGAYGARVQTLIESIKPVHDRREQVFEQDWRETWMQFGQSYATEVASAAIGGAAGKALVGVARVAAPALRPVASRMGSVFARGGKAVERIAPKTMLPESDSALGHIFRSAEGHIPDTAQNRQLLDFVARNPSTTHGVDKYVAEWSTMMLPNETQAWTRVMNGRVINGGVNLTPKTYNPITGLSSPIKP